MINIEPKTWGFEIINSIYILLIKKKKKKKTAYTSIPLYGEL